MKNNSLKEITDLTINELLSNEVILPSTYFECFNKHAQNIDIALDSENFEKELNNLIVQEYNNINNYVNHAVKSIDSAANLTLEASKAIEENNSVALKSLYTQIKNLQNELESITNNVYKDYLTKVHNKKWLYHKYLTKDITFKNDAIIVLIDVVDFDYISKTYNKLIADNLLIYISKYIQTKLQEERVEFEITRYLTNKFIISIEKESLSEMVTLFNTIANLLVNTTLKSNSGVMIKPTYEYSLMRIKESDSFISALEILLKDTQSKRK